MKILGISAYCSNASACIVINGRVVAAAQEERFTRVMGDASFPSNAIDFCLTYSNLELKDLDAITLHDKPLLKFERLLETHYAYAPRGLKSFLLSMPAWIHEKVFLRSVIVKELKKLRKSNPRKIKLLFAEHHLSHAASAFYPSSYNEAAILVIDNVGEWATTSISHGHNNKIKIIKELRYPHSLGLLFSSFAFYLGFDQTNYQDSISSMAKSGELHSQETLDYIRRIKGKLVDIKQDGSIEINQAYFQYTTGAHLINEQKWTELFGFPRNNTNDKFKQHHYNLAFACKAVIQEIVINLCLETKRITKSENLCLSGELFSDCHLIDTIINSGIFDKIFHSHALCDDASAMGAALATYHLYFRKKRDFTVESHPETDCFFGPSYASETIKKALEENDFQYYKYNNRDALIDDVSDLINEDRIVGIFRDRMEFGSQGNGNRSILANPDSDTARARINTEIKCREADTTLEIAETSKFPKGSFMHDVIAGTGRKSIVNSGMSTDTEPLVCSPEDAINFFINTGLDYLVMDCFLISKELNTFKHRDMQMTDIITS